MARANWDMFGTGASFPSGIPANDPFKFAPVAPPGPPTWYPVITTATVAVGVDEFNPVALTIDDVANFPLDSGELIIDPDVSDYKATYTGKSGNTLLNVLGKSGEGVIAVVPTMGVALQNGSVIMRPDYGTGYWRRQVSDVTLAETETLILQQVGLNKIILNPGIIGKRVANPILHMHRWGAAGAFYAVGFSGIVNAASHVTLDRVHLLKFDGALWEELAWFDSGDPAMAGGALPLDNGGLGFSGISGEPYFGGWVEFGSRVRISGGVTVWSIDVRDDNNTLSMRLAPSLPVVDPSPLAYGGAGFGQIANVMDTSIWVGSVVPPGFADAESTNEAYWEISNTRIERG